MVQFVRINSLFNSGFGGFGLFVPPPPVVTGGGFAATAFTNGFRIG